MRFAAPSFDERSDYSEDFEDFLDELSSREAALRRKAQSWSAARHQEVAQTERIISELSANLAHHQDALAEAQLNLRALSDELAAAKDESLSLRGRLRFAEARTAGLAVDLKTRRTLAAANDARLHEQLASLNRELRILRSIRNTS